MKSEVGSILRLNGWAGKLVLGLYGLGTTIVAVLNLGGLVEPAIGILSIGFLWAGLAMLGFPQGEPLELRWTIGIILITTMTTSLSGWNIVDPENPGYATWPLGAMTFLLFVLALRGRRGFAWIGFGALAAVSVAVAVVAGLNVLGTVNDVARQSATLLIGTLFSILFRRATHTIAAIQHGQVARATFASATDAAARESAAQSVRLEQDARPALERIISDAPITAYDLQQFAALENALRDGAPATGLGSRRITEAARQARTRGLSVNLIDDRGAELSTAEHLRVESTLLQLLAELVNGSLTARLSPVASTELATIVVEESGRYRRILVNPSSVEVSHV